MSGISANIVNGAKGMSQFTKNVLTLGAVTAATMAVTVAGTEKVTGEPKHRAGEKFSNLARLEFGVGIVGALGAGIAGICALTNLHYHGLQNPGTVTSGRVMSVFTGVTLGTLAGRLISQMDGPDLPSLGLSSSD